MATLEGKTVASTYKDLLQVSNSNSGITGVKTAVEDGEGTASPLELSSTAVNISSGFEIGGSAVTSTAAELNMNASLDTDLTSVSASDDSLASAKAIKTYVDSKDHDASNEAVGGDLTGTVANAQIASDVVGATELGVTAGTATANKALVVDGSKDINLGTGDLTATNLTGTLQTASQTNILTTGKLTSFESTGIDDNASGTALYTYTSGSDHRVGIGTANPSKTLEVVGSFEVDHGNFSGDVVNVSTDQFDAGNTFQTGEFILFGDHDGFKDKMLTLKIAGSDVFTVEPSGNVGIGTDSPGARLEVGNVSTGKTAYFRNGENALGAEDMVLHLDFDNNDGNPDDDGFFIYAEDKWETKFLVYSDGDAVNRNNSWLGISDERTKQDIKDANSQWDDIKALKVRNFKFKSDVTLNGEKARGHIGVIAQEVEEVSPKLIRNTEPSVFELEHCGFGDYQEAVLSEDGDVKEEAKWVVKQDEDGNDMKVKSMKYSILYMKAVKALQEAMERIEGLEAKVEALENQ